MISVNKVYTGYNNPEINLRWDWNSLLSDDPEMLLTRYTQRYFPEADVLVQYLNDYADCFRLNIKYGVRVERIEKQDKFKLYDSNNCEYYGKRLIVSTGFSQPYIPPIPGIELTENYIDVSVNSADFTNQRVLVIGKGNSGFETAENLIETAAVIHILSPDSLTMAWKSHYVGHLRAVNNNFLDTYQLKCQNAVLDATIKKIERQNGKLVVSVSYAHANGEEEDLIYDRVITCAGFRFDHNIFADNCQPYMAINDRFPAQTSEWESSNVKDLYFAGVLMQMRDLKKTTSGFIHGFRYNIRALFKILQKKYCDCPWPSYEIDISPESLVIASLRRINSSSGLWQQFGFLCDLIVLSNRIAHYYEEVPVDYIQDGKFDLHSNYFTVTLEFGKVEGDPFKIERQPLPEEANSSVFLHPVIRHFHGSSLIAEKHLLEDLDAEWKKEQAHIQPLRNFFNSQLCYTNATV